VIVQQSLRKAMGTVEHEGAASAFPSDYIEFIGAKKHLV
jgi:hypothetical protein